MHAICSARRGHALRALAGLLILLAGCNNDTEKKWWFDDKKAPPPPEPEVRRAADPVLGGTIGQQVLLGSAEPLRLRGFGVVIGLGENGSRECPTSLREYLIDYLNKEVLAPEGPSGRRSQVSAEAMLDSLDSAVVEVVGDVPAGALRGTPFDIRVEALGGTNTRSLEGGILVPTELRLYEVNPARTGMRFGRPLARARGPIFINPFAGEAGSGDPRRGVVLGGAVSLDARPVRFLLQEPSYSIARKIESRINERFGIDEEPAEALSKGAVTVRTPRSFAFSPERFIQLASHLYLQNSPGFYERRLRDLQQIVTRPGADYGAIELVWEGIGRVGIEQVQPLYDNPNPLVQFAAAQAGLRLDDVTALPVVAGIAQTAGHPNRIDAIRLLGETRYARAGYHLVGLLDDGDQRVRIAAYEALLKRKHPKIRSIPFAHVIDRLRISFTLDIVESSASPMIYVRRTREPRIALFGRETPVVLPLFYRPQDNCVTLNANGTAEDLTLVFTPRVGPQKTCTIVTAPRVLDLIARLAELPVEGEDGKLRGVGLGYSQVVRILGDLCRDGSIPAAFEVERTDLLEKLGPAPAGERPEAEGPIDFDNVELEPTSRPDEDEPPIDDPTLMPDRPESDHPESGRPEAEWESPQ